MSVDLGDRVPDLLAEINAPGINSYPEVTDDSVWIDKLKNGFWSAVLEGVIKGYAVDDDGLITPTSGATDMPRDLQQIIVLYTAYKIVLYKLLEAKTQFKATAGPVSYETQQSANVLRDVLKNIRDSLNLVIARLGDLHSVNTTVLDAIVERSYSMAFSEQWWIRP